MKIFEITKKRLREEQVAKLSRIVPGAEAEIDMGNGTKTVVDLKKNPTALTKSPDGKIMMNTQGVTSGGVQTSTPDPSQIMKPGEPVMVTAKTTEDEDSVRILRGPHGKMRIDRSRPGVTKVTRRSYQSTSDDPDKERGEKRGRPLGRRVPDHRSMGMSGGVGVPQKSSFSDVASDFKANRKRPYLDYDDDDFI